MIVPKPKRGRRLAIGLALVLIAYCAITAWQDTMADPIVRQTEVAIPGIASGSPPLRLVVMSDLHVAGPDMPPSRLQRIVSQVNALNPDYVMIAGDLVSDRRLATRYYSLAEAIAPLAALKPRFGTVAVLGNHDHWRDANEARKQLQKANAVVLDNAAVRIGPLTVGGLDDEFTHHADPSTTAAAMRHLGPPYVMVSHSPDPFPDLPADIPLMLAGHTHCGQVRYPWGGTPATMSRYGDRYGCGRIDEGGRTLVVTAGLGVSVLPFRFGTRPDVWLVELTPK
jgi:predicted MPP superfamily phosphohydrolase